MANMGKFTADELKKFQKQLNKLQGENLDSFIDTCAKELAARFLAKVIKRTPVGVYPKSSGKKGGTLRRGWTSKKGAEDGGNLNAKAYADSLTVKHFSNYYIIEMINPVEYASYVEYGHRAKNHKEWVQGHFMMTISEQEVQDIAPKVLENKIKKFMRECLK